MSFSVSNSTMKPLTVSFMGVSKVDIHQLQSGRSMRVERSKNGQSGRSAKIEGPEVWIALKRGKFRRSFDHKEDGPIISKNLSYYL